LTSYCIYFVFVGWYLLDADGLRILFVYTPTIFYKRCVHMFKVCHHTTFMCLAPLSHWKLNMFSKSPYYISHRKFPQ